MNENLIFEGNTIYELDPVCLREKKVLEKRKRKKTLQGNNPKPRAVDKKTGSMICGLICYLAVRK